MSDPSEVLALQTEIEALEAQRDARPLGEHSDPLSEATRINTIIFDKKVKLREATAPPPPPPPPTAEQVMADVRRQQEVEATRQYLLGEINRHTGDSERQKAALAQLEALSLRTVPAPDPPKGFDWPDYHAGLSNAAHLVGPNVAPALRDRVALLGQVAGWLPSECLEIAHGLAEVQSSIAGKVVEITINGRTESVPMHFDDLEPLPKLKDSERTYLHRAIDALPEDEVDRLVRMGAYRSEPVRRALVRAGRRMSQG